MGWGDSGVGGWAGWSGAMPGELGVCDYCQNLNWGSLKRAIDRRQEISSSVPTGNFGLSLAQPTDVLTDNRYIKSALVRDKKSGSAKNLGFKGFVRSQIKWHRDNFVSLSKTLSVVGLQSEITLWF